MVQEVPIVKGAMTVSAPPALVPLPGTVPGPWTPGHSPVSGVQDTGHISYIHIHTIPSLILISILGLQSEII